MAQIGYAAFIRIFNVLNPADWVPGLEVRTDGIWIVPPSNDVDCTPEERAILSEHPENDLSKPALPFPCDYHRLEKFLSFLGMPLEVFIGDKWYPGQDLVKEYGLQNFQLFDLLREGVRARTVTGLEVVNEDELEKQGRKSLEELERIEFIEEGKARTGTVLTGRGPVGNRFTKRTDDEIKRAARHAFEMQPKNVLVIPNGCEAISYSLSYNDNTKRMEAICRAAGFLYKTVDVIKYMWDQNIVPVGSSILPEKQKELEPNNAANFFKKSPGDYWHVRFDEDGRDVMIKHLDGLFYISYLLEKPGSIISCQKLYQAVSGKDAANAMSKDVAISEGLNIGSSSQPVYGERELALFREEYDNLKVELQSAGMEEREEIEEKLKQLKPCLTRRNFPESNEKKMQVNIRKRLDTAYKAIKKAKMHKLAKHLQDHIKPDGAFGLCYLGSITWEITPIK